MEFTTPKRIKKWKNLNPITAEIIQDDSIEVGMLIWANYMKALEHMEVIASQDGGLVYTRPS